MVLMWPACCVPRHVRTTSAGQSPPLSIKQTFIFRDVHLCTCTNRERMIPEYNDGHIYYVEGEKLCLSTVFITVDACDRGTHCWSK